MAKEVLMPKLGASMETGTILQWFKEEGEFVSEGEMLFEVMTDKINIEMEAESSGVLLKKIFNADDEVPVHQAIAYIGEEGEKISVQSSVGAEQETPEVQVGTEQISVIPAQEKEVTGNGKVRATPAARKFARDNDVDLNQVEGGGPRGRVHLADVKEFVASGSVKATPLAKKIANTEQVDLKQVQGSGVHGKVMSKDVRSTLNGADEQQVDEKIPVKGIRKVVSERMVDSAFTAPHVTITTEVQMTAVKAMREQLLPQIEKETGYRLSYTEIIMKAVTSALKNHRIINSSLKDDHILLHSSINIGLAVAIPDGLVVPVVHNADKKGLAELTAESKKLGQAARENKLGIDQMSGGTFTISNLGMYAVDTFTPIINQPESAILGVGRIVEKPIGVNGQIELHPMMSLSLTFDHRVIDGAPAAAFLTELKEIFENPLLMLL